MDHVISESPVSTYRIQLSKDFTFFHAGDLADYLKDLGVSHLYASPYLKASSGSPHGYNVVDYGQVNPELGGKRGHDHFCNSLKQLNIGQVIDIVPNHMAVGKENKRWQDVLEKGSKSVYASFFDINWDVSDPKLTGKILLPILGDHYSHCLEKGEIRLHRNGAGFYIHYYEHQMPISSASLSDFLADMVGQVDSPNLGQIMTGSGPLDAMMDGDRGPAGPAEGDDFRNELERLLTRDPALGQKIDARIAQTNADPERLDFLLEKQHFRLSYWRTAGSDINYRRFFDITHLAGLCVEKENVFAETHRLVKRWIDQGRLAGLRIDHPDGLRDPLEYLRRLRRAALKAWIVVEKILEPGEHLPKSWPVSGTTGYDFLNMVGGLFVDPSAEKAFTELYRQITGEASDYQEIVREKKHQVLSESFASELSSLTELLVDIRFRYRRYRDLMRKELYLALKEIAASFPVYRTYIRADNGETNDEDTRILKDALREAQARIPGIDPEVWKFFDDLFCLRLKGTMESDGVMRFQQLTGPAMAKGAEDTAFYCFNRLISLNEVGGYPARFGVSPAAFHDFCQRIQTHWPQTMLTTSTHDTKRGEDTRLRISLLSEIPQQWSRAVRRWFEMNAAFRKDGAPDPNTEYLLYQTLVGSWPIDERRLSSYMIKAVREAKTRTSWSRPNDRYEKSLDRFVRKVLSHRKFTQDLNAFLTPLADPARVSSLSQTLIKSTAPGIPDFYQGSELWDLTLVDPDNRRPTDFELRRRLMAELKHLPTEKICSRFEEGMPKLFVIWKALSLRREHPELFGPAGAYTPLYAEGEKADHIVAFLRGGRVATVAPRFPVKLGGDWKDTVMELSGGQWTNVLTGERLSGGRHYISDLLKEFPVGLFRKGMEC